MHERVIDLRISHDFNSSQTSWAALPRALQAPLNALAREALHNLAKGTEVQRMNLDDVQPSLA